MVLLSYLRSEITTFSIYFQLSISIFRQIATASGPCGNNREYIFKMEKALHDISHEDDYIIELANEVRKVLGIAESVPKEKKLLSPSQIPLKSHISPVKLHPLPEAIAAVTADS